MEAFGLNMRRPAPVFTKPLVCLTVAVLCATGRGAAQDWENVGLLDQQLSDIAVQDGDTIFASTYTHYDYGNIFRTTNGGLTWDTTFASVGTARLARHPTNLSVVYAGLGSLDGPWGIVKTGDSGANWFHADSGLYAQGEFWIRGLELDPLHPETLYAATSNGYGFYKSTNGGESWYAPAGSMYFYHIAIDPISTETIYASSQYGAGLFKSIDAGITWEETSLMHGIVNGLAIDPMDTDIIYAGLGGGLGFYRSTDAGETWEHLTTGLPTNVGGGSLVVNRISREVFGVMFASDSAGVFRSTDLGMTWERLQGLPAGRIWPTTTIISPDQTKLYLGYYNLGIFRTTILVTDVPTEDGSIPVGFALLQNYPNPFNPTTTFEFSIPSSLIATLSIYNLLGEKVATVIDEQLSAGTHRVTWDATDQPSGVYFYRLRAGEFTETKKLVLVR